MSNGRIDVEDLDSLVEALNDMEADTGEADYSEARRRPRTATGRNLSPQRPVQNNVTQAQLQAALARVGAQIQENSKAINTVNSRVNTLTTSTKKEIDTLKKASESQKKDLGQLRDMSALIPLLTQSQSIAPQTAQDFPAGTKLLEQPGTLSLLLPLLLLGGLGGESSGSGAGGLFGGGTDSTTTLLLVLLLAGGGGLFGGR